MEECEYCHGGKSVARIAQKMGFRPDAAFLRINKLENIMQKFIDDYEVEGEDLECEAYANLFNMILKK